MKKKKKERIWLKYILSTIGLIICLIVIGGASYHLYEAFTDYSYQDKYTSYEVTDDVEYKVYMKDNSYIPNEYLLPDQTYIAKVVDHIDLDYSFKYANNEDVLKSYQYKIVGTLNGSYKDESGVEAIVWSEEKNYINSDIEETDQEVIEITDKVTTNVDSLTTRVKAFQADMGINVLANYQVAISVVLTFENDIIKTHTAYVTIPVNVSVFGIEKVVENHAMTTIEGSTVSRVIDKEYLILAVILFVLAIMAVINILKKGYEGSKSEYDKELEEIFNLYGDRIVSVNNLTQKEHTEIIDLLGFEEMIELVNELNLPILCWHKPGHRETWFCALKGNIIYRYLITE